HKIDGLLLGEPQDRAVTHRHEVMPPLARLAAFVRLAGRRADVLALMADAAGTLADGEAAPRAEVNAPWIAVRILAAERLAAAPIDLGGRMRRRIRKRETDVGIDRVVQTAAETARAAARHQPAGAVIVEGRRDFFRPLDLGGLSSRAGCAG